MIARALEAEILRLHHAEGWPIGTIATQLRLHHGTVRRVLTQAGVPAAAPAVRATLLDPYRAFILQSLEKYPSLRASRLYAMVRERGYDCFVLLRPSRWRRPMLLRSRAPEF